MESSAVFCFLPDRKSTLSFSCQADWHDFSGKIFPSKGGVGSSRESILDSLAHLQRAREPPLDRLAHCRCIQNIVRNYKIVIFCRTKPPAYSHLFHLALPSNPRPLSIDIYSSGYEWEVVIIEDSSPDGTYEVALKLHQIYGPRIVRLLLVASLIFNSHSYSHPCQMWSDLSAC